MTSPISGTESQHLPFDGMHVGNEATSPRRHIRYTSPDTSIPHSPRRISDTAAGQGATPSSNGDHYSTADRTPRAISPFLVARVLQETGSDSRAPLPEVNGQNHDRMDMDVDSEDSMSENQSHAAAQTATETPNLTVQQADGEIMDITPDSPVVSSPQPVLDSGA